MEHNQKRKPHFAFLLLLVMLFFAGIIIYAYKFPSTFALFDRKAEEISKLLGHESECGIFTEFSEFAAETVNKTVCIAEIIKENIKGNFSDIKSLPSVILSCPAGFPTDNETITSDFGERTDPISGELSFHKGIDIAAAKGSKIYSAWPGTVKERGTDKIYGNYIVIKHSKNLMTKYCHLSEIFVDEGEFVKNSYVIGAVGDSGRTTGAHLHFEVILDNINIDPKECFEI